jgi:hypothetical protein
VLPGPLHRLTRLTDDPASRWLKPIDRLIVVVQGWAAWVLYAAFMRGVLLAFDYVISTATGGNVVATTVRLMAWENCLSLEGFLTAAVGAAAIVPMRRAVIRLRARSTAKMARQAGMDGGAAIDDLDALDGEADGRIVSLVGWVRGQGYVDHPVEGKRAVGLALPCQDTSPYVMETLHNFELVDEVGGAVLVATGDGRLLGPSNVQLSRASADDRQLLMSLELPPTMTPADWNACVVRDGDPVMVVGTKTTIQDLTRLQQNRRVDRTAVASTKGRPLLVFPLDAERREV